MLQSSGLLGFAVLANHAEIQTTHTSHVMAHPKPINPIGPKPYIYIYPQNPKPYKPCKPYINPIINPYFIPPSLLAEDPPSQAVSSPRHFGAEVMWGWTCNGDGAHSCTSGVRQVALAGVGIGLSGRERASGVPGFAGGSCEGSSAAEGESCSSYSESHSSWLAIATTHPPLPRSTSGGAEVSAATFLALCLNRIVKLGAR